ncbi:MAG: CotH kinase family protein [Bacteroidia bacterium]|nr:CotH kinase family protein [Bacteroidia bacterium]
MKAHFKIFILAALTFSASISGGQDFPDMMGLSLDGRRLITGNKPSTGFYEPFLMHDIHLNFSDPNFWTELEDNYYDKIDIPATMTINGVVYDSVGVRFKGHSSYTRIGSSVKKSFNISLNEYISGQDIEGYNTLNLNNCYNDASFMAEVLYEGQARKHIPAPKGNFAHLFINGQDWGIYANVQQVNRDLIKEWFPSDQGSLLRAKRPAGSPGVSDTVGKASMNNLGTDVQEYSWYYTENHSTIPNVYEKLMEACIILDTVSSTHMQTVLGDVLDLDRALWFLATENAFCDMDGYVNKGKNDYYLFYEDETARFHMIEMDGNDVLETIEVGSMSPFFNSTNVNFPLLSKVLSVPAMRQRYLAHLRTIIDDAMNTTELFPLIDTYSAILDPFISQNTPKLYTYFDFQTKVQTLKINIQTRKAFLLSNSEVDVPVPSISNTAWIANQIPWKLPADNEDVTVRTTVSSSTGIDKVNLYYATGITGQFSKRTMYDDGAHDDLLSGDGIYGATISGKDGGTWVRFYIEAVSDNSAKTVSYDPPGAEHDIYAYLVQPKFANDRSIVINEVMANNNSTITDPTGEYSDWIELYNTSGQAKDISGFYLSDDPHNLIRWEFPSGTIIQPNDYLIVWANDKNGISPLYTNFKLSAGGDQLYLLNDNIELVDSMSFGAQGSDVSHARVLNGTGNFLAQGATFGFNNNPIPQVAFSVQSSIGCIPFTVQFVNHSLNAMSYSWEFGDGNSSSDFAPMHTYLDTGSYKVTLIGTTGNFSDTLSITGLINVFEHTPFNFPADTINPGTVSYQLGASASYYGYSWSTGDTTQNINVPLTGLYCVTVTDQNSCTSSDCVYVIITPNSIPESEAESLTLFPNPANEYIKLTSKSSISSQVKIYNSIGKLIYENTFSNSLLVPTQSWPEGIYFVRSESFLEKLIISR